MLGGHSNGFVAISQLSGSPSILYSTSFRRKNRTKTQATETGSRRIDIDELLKPDQFLKNCLSRVECLFKLIAMRPIWRK
jgi:hypothetical protein